jgi:hypothetical protein
MLPYKQSNGFALSIVGVLTLMLLAGCQTKSEDKPLNGAGGSTSASPGKNTGPRQLSRAMYYNIVNRLLPQRSYKAEGLEARNGWKPAAWEDKSYLKILRDHKADDVILFFEGQGGKKGKNALEFVANMKLAKKGSLQISFYNYNHQDVKVAAAFWFSNSWVYYESLPQTVAGRKWTRLSFDLAASSYKTPSSKWKHNCGLWKREQMKKMALLVYHGGQPVKLILDGIVLDQQTAAEKTTTQP